MWTLGVKLGGLEQLIMYLLSADTSCEGEGGPDTPALIICSKEFDYLSNQYGSEVDLLGMQDLLENRGYSVVVKEDLTALVMDWESATSFLFS